MQAIDLVDMRRDYVRLRMFGYPGLGAGSVSYYQINPTLAWSAVTAQSQ